MFAQRVYGRGLNVSLSIQTEANDVTDFYITRKNSLLLQQQALQQPQSPLYITAKGDGCIMLQV